MAMFIKFEKRRNHLWVTLIILTIQGFYVKPSILRKTKTRYQENTWKKAS